MWDLLLESLAKKGVELTPSELEFLQSVFQYKRFRKNQYILQQGDVARYESFVIKGLARKYEVDDKGQEHILSFNTEGWWAGDLYSFHTGSPTLYNVDCLEETEVLRITKTNLENLFAQIPKMNVYFRLLYQNSIVAYNQRLASSLSKSALERYKEFLSRYPHVEQRIPNYQIASFLGITPQSLSRLRKQNAEKV